MDALDIRPLLDEEVFQESIERINKLTSDSQPNWGKMDVAQMLAHCAEVQDVCNGKKLKSTPFLIKLIKGTIRKMVVNTKAYKRNSPTHPQYKIVEQKDFNESRDRLIASLNKFKADAAAGINPPHSFFGPMTLDEKSWAMYKHLNHHLGQFGV